MTISFTLIVFLKLFSFIISEKVVLNREELSPYECGFEHHNVSRIPFSLRYFFLTLIFLLFDLEIVLMLFVPFSIFSSSF
jgi:NADH-ubiquinone oxidoreductase chain 3